MQYPPPRHGLTWAALIAAGAVLLAACSSGGGAEHAPAGTPRPLGFGTHTRIELFIPDGWDMINQDNLQDRDITDPQPANGVTYAIVDTARIPASVTRAVATDDEARDAFARQALSGAAVTAQFTELGECDAVGSMLRDRRDAIADAAAGEASVDQVDSGLGDDRVVIESTRDVDGARYRYVQYLASVQLSETHCVGMQLGATVQAGGNGEAGSTAGGADGAADADGSADTGGAADAAGAAREVIEEIADNSTTEELGGLGGD